MEIKRVPVSKLKGATYNPRSRAQGKGITSLIKSIANIGLMQPILVTKDLKVIDGHRRLAAVTELEWEEVPVLIGSSDLTPEQVYAEINSTNLKMTGNQNLAVFLKRPSAVTERARRKFELLAEKFGVSLLKELVAKGMSSNVIRTANRVATYLDIDQDNAREMKKIAKWLILYRNSRAVHAYIETQQPARTLLNAITANKQLRMSYRV